MTHAARRRTVLRVAPLVLALLLAACAPGAVGDPQAVLVLPDGARCLFSGFGATLAYEGRRVSHTCSDDLVLLGPPSFAGARLDVVVAALDGTRVTSTSPLDVEIGEIELADGTVCRNAGTGATLAVDGRRLSFTCGEGAGLIGDPVWRDGVVYVERAGMRGTTVTGTGIVAAARVQAAPR